MDREVKVIDSGAYKKLKMLNGYNKIETDNYLTKTIKADDMLYKDGKILLKLHNEALNKDMYLYADYDENELLLLELGDYTQIVTEEFQFKEVTIFRFDIETSTYKNSLSLIVFKDGTTYLLKSGSCYTECALVYDTLGEAVYITYTTIDDQLCKVCAFNIETRHNEVVKYEVVKDIRTSESVVLSKDKGCYTIIDDKEPERINNVYVKLPKKYGSRWFEKAREEDELGNEERHRYIIKDSDEQSGEHVLAKNNKFDKLFVKVEWE